MVSPNFFFIKIVSAVFEIFQKKKKQKKTKTLFSFMITILEHTLYGKVKIYSRNSMELDKIKNIEFFFQLASRFVNLF